MVVKYEIPTFAEITAVATYERKVVMPAMAATVFDVPFKRQLYAPPLMGRASTTSVYTDLYKKRTPAIANNTRGA